MAYAPRKKKNLWDNIIDTLGGAADAVIPGDQSSWRSAPTREEQVTPISRPQATAPLQVTQARPSTNILNVGKPTTFDDLEVGTATPQANITVKPAIDEKAVNERLDRGYSWEQIAKETNTDVNKVKEFSQRTRPNYGVAPKDLHEFTDYKMEKTGNKKIFGLDVGQYMGDYGDENKMTVDQKTSQMTEQDFLKGYDYIGRENAKANTGKQTQDMYTNKLKEMAKNGDERAKYTLDVLVKNGKLKGDAMDVIDSANNEFLGGLNRSAARVIDWLPGDQGTAKWADNQEEIWKGSSDADKIGENVGKVERVGLDVGLMLTPAGWVDKGVKGTKVVQAIGNTNKAAGFVARTLPGSAVATGMDMFSQASQGNDQDLARSAAIGTAVDLGLPIIGKIPGVDKVVSKTGDVIVGGARKVGDVIEAGKNNVAEIRNGVDDLIETARQQFAPPKKGTIKINNPDGAVVGQTKTTDLTPQELPVVSVKRADGRLEQYQPKSAEELAIYQKQIDDARIANGDTAEGVAGKADANGDVWHISSGSQVKKNYAPIQDAPTPAFNEVPKSKLAVDPNDQMARLRERAANPTQQPNIAEQYGLKPETVERLVRDYGVDKTRSIIQRSSDATNIRSMDAFVVSEAKKQYGNVAPVPVKESTFNPQTQQATPEDLTVRTDNVVQEPTIVPPVRTAPVESNLGKIAETFYDSKVGNQRIKFRDLENVGRQVSKEIDTAFKQVGSDFPAVARKVEEANRAGVRSLDEVDLTDVEKDLWRKAQAEMDYVRRRASLGKREVSTGDFGETYFPNQSKDAYPTRESLFEGFRDTKPGNEIVRKGGIELDEMSFSPDVIGGYITRYGDTKLLQEERIYRAMAKNNPDLPEEQIRDAAQEVIDLQHRVNNLTTKVKLTGQKVTANNGEKVKIADDLNAIGQKLGKQQKEITGTPRGLTNGDRINSVDIDDNGVVKTAGDYIGLNQFRDAGSYAGTQTKAAGGDRDALAQMVEERLSTAYKIPAEDVQYAVETVRRIKGDLPDNLVQARVEGIYRNAAKGQILEQLQNVKLTNKTLNNDVTKLVNQIVREGSIESELSAKIVQKTLRGTNALFRKLNVSSAINELSDMTSFFSAYGKNLKAATPDFNLIKEMGLGELDPALDPYIKAIDSGQSVKSVLGKINEGTRLYKFVEQYKAGVFLKTARDHYAAKGLTGDALTAQVLKDYREMALPVDAFTKTFLDDFPLFTQYLTWGARNMQKEGRLLTGQIDAGILKDKSNLQRIARNAYANLPAKTAFWLASNGLKGTAIMTAFGLTDFTGLTSQDYSGIAEEDKSFFDKTTQFTNISTVASLLNTTIQALEKEGLKEKYKDADYNPYENADFGESFINTYTPQFIKNIGGATDLQQKGYSESKGGRVQYEAPEDPYNIFKSFVFGKNQTANAREYSGRENLVDRMGEGKDPFTAVKDMAGEQIGLQEGDYNRPLTEDYSKKYKEVDEGARTALLQGGRQYNDYLDNLKKDNPDMYNNYIASMNDHVSPEYWNTNTNGGKDLTNFHMMRDRKRQLNKDLGTTYDPLFDLPDDQASAVLAYKSAATGDDLSLRNNLNKEQWYKDFKDRQGAFYDAQVDDGGEGYKETERMKQWGALEDQLNSFYYDKESKETPAWAEAYPAVFEQKKINAQYGFGSPESDAWFKMNGDAYTAQKEGFDKSQLQIINQMRKIEGYPEMSWEAYQQATEIADTDTSDDKQYGKSGGGDGSVSPNANGSYSHTGASGVAKTVKINMKKVALKKKAPAKKIAIKRGGKI